MNLSSSKEWLEADGRGGFASGTENGSRVVLVNGFDAWIETAEGKFALTSQRYAPEL